MRSRVTAIVLVIIGLVTLGYNACTGPLKTKNSGSHGTVFGNPFTEVSFSTYAVKGEKNFLELCVSEVRMYSAEKVTTITEGFPQYLPISHLGNMFTTFLSPLETYTRVDVDLKNACDKEFSARIENGNGTFSSTENLTMKFSGNVHLASQGYRVDLIVQNFTNALSLVSNNFDIASAIGNEEGRVVAAKAGWRSLSMVNAPIARSRHSAVWTGKHMIIWGGSANFNDLNSGSAYEPIGDTWTTISDVNAPAGRVDHLAVWTGKEMIVWGGRADADVPLNTGGLYNPTTDTWRPMTTRRAPSPRRMAGHVWTGKYLFIFGGLDPDNGNMGDGGRYDPEADEWLPVTTVNSPPIRDIWATQWTGKFVILWIGRHVKTYDPNLDVWGDLPDAPVQGAIYSAWTGTHLLSWGNNYGAFTSPGAVYNLAGGNQWTQMSSVNAPADRATTAGVWTGKSLLIWGGATDATKTVFTNEGHQYFHETDTWRPFLSEGNPEPRYLATAVWTGSEMIVWGGTIRQEWNFGDGGRYTPLH